MSILRILGIKPKQSIEERVEEIVDLFDCQDSHVDEVLERLARSCESYSDFAHDAQFHLGAHYVITRAYWRERLLVGEESGFDGNTIIDHIRDIAPSYLSNKA